MTPTYQILIDFDNDGILEADVSSDIVDVININSGRSDMKGSVAVGTCDFYLSNLNGAYKPGVGNIKPGRLVKIKATYDGTTYDLYTGYIEDFFMAGTLTNPKVYITTSDLLKKIDDKKLTKTFSVGTTFKQIVEQTLEAIGLEATQYNVDDMPTDYISSELVFTNASAVSIIQLVAEAGHHHFYCDPSGVLQFRHRHFYMDSEPYEIYYGQQGTGLKNLNAPGLKYSKEKIYNEVKVIFDGVNDGEALDSSSQTAYGIKSLVISNSILAKCSSVQCQNLATYIMLLDKEPRWIGKGDLDAYYPDVFEIAPGMIINYQSTIPHYTFNNNFKVMGISKTITPGADSCKMSLVLEEQFDFGLGLIQNIIENSTIRLFSTIILQQKNINSPASGVWTPTPIGNLYRGQLEVYIGTSRIFHDDGNGLILDEALATVGAVTNYATGALSINAGVYTPSTQHLFKFNMFRCEQKTSNGSGEISTTLATPPIARTSLMVYLPGGDRVAFDQAGVQTIIEDNSSGINGSIIYNDGTLILAGCQNNTVYNICYGNLRIIGQIFKAIESALIYRLAMKAKKIIHTSGSSQHHFRLINASVLTWENLWVADSFEVDSPDFQEYQSENYNGMVLQIDKDTLYVILMDWAEQDIFPASAKAAALEYSDQFTIGRATQPKKYQVQHINVPGNSSSLNASLPTNIKKGTLKIYLGNQQIGHDDNDNGDILPDNFAGTQNILTKQTEYSKNIYLKAIIDQTSIIINDADGLAGTEDGDGTIDGIENPGQSMETVTGPAEFSKSLTNIARPKTDGSFIVKIGSTTVGTVANVATTIVGIEELGLSGNFTTGAAETSKTINLGALKTDTGVTPNRYKFNLYIAGTFVGESFSSGAPSGKVLLFNAADQLNSIFNEDNFVASGATKSASLIHGGAGVFDGVGYWVSGQIMRFYQWDSGSETWLCAAWAQTDGVIYGNGYPIAGTVNTSTGAYNITAGLVTGKTYCVRYAYFAGAISASGQIVISSGLHSSQQYDYTWDYKGLAGSFIPAQNLCMLNQLKANKTYKIEWTYLGLAGTINYNTGALNLSAGIRGGQLYEIAYTSAGVSGTINYATGALALSGFTLASGSSGCAFTCYFETETPTTGGTYFTLNWTPNKSGTLSRVRIPVKPIGTPPNIKMIVTQGLNTWTSDNTPATGEEEDIEFLFLSAGAEPLAGGIPATFKSLLDSGNGDDANYYQAGVQAIVGGMGSNVIVSNSIGNEQPLGLVDIFKPGSGPDMFVNAQAYTLPKAIGANLLDYPGAKSKLNDQPDSIWNGPGFLKSIIMPIYQPGASAPALTLYIVIGSDSYSISLSGLTQGFNHKKADINAYNFNSDSIKKPEIYIAGSAGTNVEYFPVSWQTLSAWINQVYTSAWVNQTFVPKAWLSFIMSFESFYKTAPSVFLNDTINDESTEVSIATGNPYPNGQLVALDGGGNIYYWNFTQMDAYFKIWGW